MRLSSMEMHRWPKLMMNMMNDVMNVNYDTDMIRYKLFSSVSNALNKCNIMKGDIKSDPNWANTFKRIHKMGCVP